MKTTHDPLTLSQAQHFAWLRQNPAPATSREALGRVLETARLCLEAFDESQLVAAQSRLEDVLVQTLVAMKSMDIQPEQALQRALARLQDSWSKRAFHIFMDRVEIRVQGDTRGEWPLYSQHDYDMALNLAHELGCDIIHEEACQLGIFQQTKFTTPDSQRQGQPDGRDNQALDPA